MVGHFTYFTFYKFYLMSITKILKSHYCKFVFIISFFGGYFLLPEAIFHNQNRLLAIVYLFVFASLITCVVKSIKERVKLAQKSKSSVIGAVAAILGFSAFHFCGVAAPMCGITVGSGIVALIFPQLMYNFFEQHGFVIIYLSIIIQIAALFHLKCIWIKK